MQEEKLTMLTVGNILVYAGGKDITLMVGSTRILLEEKLTTGTARNIRVLAIGKIVTTSRK
jgi:hypothetical protein